jgi:hypothetical protein
MVAPSSDGVSGRVLFELLMYLNASNINPNCLSQNLDVIRFSFHFSALRQVPR